MTLPISQTYSGGGVPEGGNITASFSNWAYSRGNNMEGEQTNSPGGVCPDDGVDSDLYDIGLNVADAWAEIVWDTPVSATYYLWATVRCTAATDPTPDNYVIFCQGTGVYLGSNVGGSFTLLATGDTTAPGDTLRVQAVGTTVTGWVNGVEVYNVTDGDLTDGSVGPGGYGFRGDNDARIVSFAAEEVGGGGTEYTQNVSGTLTSSGALVKQPRRALVGTMTSSGALNKRTSRALAGTMTSAGVLNKQLARALAGTLTSTGALIKQAGKTVAGTLTSGGALIKSTSRALSGTLTSSGALTAARTRIVELAGTLASAGALIKSTSRAVSGTLTSSGEVSKSTARALAGTMASSGTLTTIKTFVVTLSGTLTSSGSLIKQTSRALEGVLSSSGTVVKHTSRALGGTMASSGTLAAARTFVVTLSGVMASTGSLIKQTIKTLGGEMHSAGSISKSTSRALGGTMGSSGTLTAAKTMLVFLEGVLTSVGALVTSYTPGEQQREPRRFMGALRGLRGGQLTRGRGRNITGPR